MVIFDSIDVNSKSLCE